MKALGRSSLSSLLTIVLNIGWYLALAIFGLGALAIAVAPIVNPPDIEIDVAVPIAFTLDSALHDVTTSMNVEHLRLQDLEGSLHFSPRSAAFVASSGVFLMVFAALALGILGNLRAVFRTLRAGRPFVPANAIRLRRVGWLLLGAELASTAFAYLGSYSATTRFAVEGLQLHTRFDFDVFAIVGALIVLVIAEVFREGARLDEEQSLTV